jgi:hypothetical protein
MTVPVRKADPLKGPPFSSIQRPLGPRFVHPIRYTGVGIVILLPELGWVALKLLTGRRESPTPKPAAPDFSQSYPRNPPQG